MQLNLIVKKFIYLSYKYAFKHENNEKIILINNYNKIKTVTFIVIPKLNNNLFKKMRHSIKRKEDV